MNEPHKYSECANIHNNYSEIILNVQNKLAGYSSRSYGRPYVLSVNPLCNNLYKVEVSYTLDFDEKIKRWGVCEEQGTMIIAPIWDSIHTVAYFEENFIITTKILKNIYTFNDKYECSLFDTRGNEIPTKELQDNISEVLFKFSYNDKEGVLSNLHGIVIPPLYDKVEDIGFKFKWFKIKQNEFWGIWRQEAELYPPKYNNIFLEEHEFSWISNDRELNIIKIEMNNKWGIIDFRERFIEPKYEDVQPIWYDFIKVKDSGKWGLANTNGDVITPLLYDEIIFANVNLFIAKMDDKYGCINFRNELIIPFSYDLILSDKDGDLHAKKDIEHFCFDDEGNFLRKMNIIKDYSLGYDRFEFALEQDCENINLFVDAIEKVPNC